MKLNSDKYVPELRHFQIHFEESFEIFILICRLFSKSDYYKVIKLVIKLHYDLVKTLDLSILSSRGIMSCPYILPT